MEEVRPSFFPTESKRNKITNPLRTLGRTNTLLRPRPGSSHHPRRSRPPYQTPFRRHATFPTNPGLTLCPTPAVRSGGWVPPHPFDPIIDPAPGPRLGSPSSPAADRPRRGSHLRGGRGRTSEAGGGGPAFLAPRRDRNPDAAAAAHSQGPPRPRPPPSLRPLWGKHKNTPKEGREIRRRPTGLDRPSSLSCARARPQGPWPLKTRSGLAPGTEGSPTGARGQCSLVFLDLTGGLPGRVHRGVPPRVRNPRRLWREAFQLFQTRGLFPGNPGDKSRDGVGFVRRSTTITQGLTRKSKPTHPSVPEEVSVSSRK